MAPKARANLEGFWKTLSDDAALRERFCRDGSLFAWPNAKLTGIINFETMKQNVGVLMHLVQKWCPQVQLKTIPPELARVEAQV